MHPTVLLLAAIQQESYAKVIRIEVFILVRRGLCQLAMKRSHAAHGIKLSKPFWKDHHASTFIMH